MTFVKQHHGWFNVWFIWKIFEYGAMMILLKRILQKTKTTHDQAVEKGTLNYHSIFSRGIRE